MATNIVPKITANFRARTASGREVSIQEITKFHHFVMDGRVEITEGIKAYSINPREPVNRDDSGFTLARTGERLELL